MAGFDKWQACEKLKALGWTDLGNNELAPPDSLWANKPQSFYVYDAQALQDLLAPTTEDEDVQ